MRIDPDELAWSEPAPGIRNKCVTQDGRHIRLIELSEGFREADWCRRGHIGYVLAGRLEITYPDRVEELLPGHILLIREGDAEKHRARVIQGPVRVFLVEDQ
jgi:hypothetical protein